MHCVLNTHQLAVFDDVLTGEQFNELFLFVQDQPFIPVHMNKWAKVWSLTDGSPYISRSFYSASLTNPDCTDDEDDFDIYPTGDSIDDLFHAINSIENDVVNLIGQQGVQWARYSAAAFVYPLHSGLSWHTDDKNYTGAFTFYLSPVWETEWGGELFIQTPIETVSGNNAVQSDDNPDASLGYYIAPKPNRLVIIKGGTPHKINPVSAAAGDRGRYSISGFFNKAIPSREQTTADIHVESYVEKLSTRYVARLHENKASINARGLGNAMAESHYIDLFRFIETSEKPFRIADLPGVFTPSEKLQIACDLIASDILQPAHG